MRELKADNKDALKELAKLEKQAARAVAQTSKSAVSQVSQPATRAKKGARSADGRSADLEIGDTAGLETCATFRTRLQPVLDQLAALEAALVPYEAIKEQLAEARARYRTLPVRLLDYIIMHELVHLVEGHHGPEFWQALGRAMPDWQKRKDALAGKAKDYLVFGLRSGRAGSRLGAAGEH